MISKQIEENKKLSLEEELAKLKSAKTFDSKSVDRIVEIEKTLQATQIEAMHIKELDNVERKNNSSQIISEEVIESGKATGMTLVKH